jgi:hypothetical protein
VWRTVADSLRLLAASATPSAHGSSAFDHAEGLRTTRSMGRTSMSVHGPNAKRQLDFTRSTFRGGPEDICSH